MITHEDVNRVMHKAMIEQLGADSDATAEDLMEMSRNLSDQEKIEIAKTQLDSWGVDYDTIEDAAASMTQTAMMTLLDNPGSLPDVIGAMFRAGFDLGFMLALEKKESDERLEALAHLDFEHDKDTDLPD